MTPDGTVLMARYNQWMNERLYGACATLTPQALRQDRQAFFGSVLGTLNHLAVGDTLWMHRFVSRPESLAVRADMAHFPHPTSLRDTLHDQWGDLLRYRQRLDELIVRWAQGLSAQHLAEDFAYTNVAGEPACRPFGAVVQHFFNHQTHHRGQVSTLLFQAGVDVGVTDLLAVIADRRVSP